MRLQSLLSVAPGIVNATVLLDNDQSTDVQFTTEYASGIDMANPTPPDVFQMETVAAEQTRRIVAAVVAFDRAATG
jgi:hypothetical protein